MPFTKPVKKRQFLLPSRNEFGQLPLERKHDILSRLSVDNLIIYLEYIITGNISKSNNGNNDLEFNKSGFVVLEQIAEDDSKRDGGFNNNGVCVGGLTTTTSLSSPSLSLVSNISNFDEALVSDWISKHGNDIYTVELGQFDANLSGNNNDKADNTGLTMTMSNANGSNGFEDDKENSFDHFLKSINLRSNDSNLLSNGCASITSPQFQQWTSTNSNDFYKPMKSLELESIPKQNINGFETSSFDNGNKLTANNGSKSVVNFPDFPSYISADLMMGKEKSLKSLSYVAELNKIYSNLNVDDLSASFENANINGTGNGNGSKSLSIMPLNNATSSQSIPLDTIDPRIFAKYNLPNPNVFFRMPTDNRAIILEQIPANIRNKYELYCWSTMINDKNQQQQQQQQQHPQ